MKIASLRIKYSERAIIKVYQLNLRRKIKWTKIIQTKMQTTTTQVKMQTTIVIQTKMQTATAIQTKMQTTTAIQTEMQIIQTITTKNQKRNQIGSFSIALFF